MILHYVLLAVDLSLIAFMVICYARRPVSRREDKVFFLIPAGETIERWLKPKALAKESDEVHRILVETSGREDGERLYHRFRCRRWGMMIGATALILSMYLATAFLHANRGSEPLFELVRPEHGEGSSKSHVTLTIEGEEKPAEMVLEVPEKSLSDEERRAAVQAALEKLKEALASRVFAGDLKLPRAIGEVRISYQSLSPSVLTSDGEWLGACGDERVEASLRASAVLGTVQEECVVTFYRAAFSELDEKAREEQLLARIREDIAVGEEVLMLPSQTQDGAAIVWENARPGDSLLWGLLLLLVPLLLYFKEAADYKQLADKRLAAIKVSYPEFLGELVILIGAGLSLMSAWKRIGADYREERAKSGKSDALLEEVERAAREMEEGSSMREALEAFSARIPLREVRRFIALLTQNLRRGDDYLKERLRQMSEEAWETRKKQVKEKSEEADTKLLLPLMMMLLVILIIVLSPAMISMNL
ncbi:MAG: type II secretion system F family protein [Firmicutes bacterium]|nr:type II secretion system F family protein [Bacillota bacterium]